MRSSQVIAFAFFVSVFSTVIWLIYTFSYISEKLSGVSFSALGLVDLSVYTSLVLLPILILWMVFGYINQYLTNSILNKNMYSLFKQMKKNQDYTDLISRIMLEAEQQIKDGFILNKFDLFIADMNELIAEIIHRSSIASPEQIERLWGKVQNGGKWAFGKVVIEVNQSQPRFQMRIFDKSQTDAVLAGTVLEFCARYTSLISLLEKHDKERVFLTIVETGVFGKVFSIFAPIADEIRKSRDFNQPRASFTKQPAAPGRDMSHAPQPMGEQEAPRMGYIPIQRTSARRDARENTFLKSAVSFFKNKIEQKKSYTRADPRVEEDPFSMALQRSFGEEEVNEPRLGTPVFTDEEPDAMMPEIKLNIEEQEEEKEFFIEEPKADLKINQELKAESIKEEPVQFSNTQKTLNTLKKEWEDMKKAEEAPLAAEAKKDMEETYSYPFGGWTDEENYSK